MCGPIQFPRPKVPPLSGLERELARLAWTPVDLVATVATPNEPPSIRGLLYAGMRTVLSGETESLKTDDYGNVEHIRTAPRPSPGGRGSPPSGGEPGRPRIRMATCALMQATTEQLGKTMIRCYYLATCTPQVCRRLTGKRGLSSSGLLIPAAHRSPTSSS